MFTIYNALAHKIVIMLLASKSCHTQGVDDDNIDYEQDCDTIRPSPVSITTFFCSLDLGLFCMIIFRADNILHAAFHKHLYICLGTSL